MITVRELVGLIRSTDERSIREAVEKAARELELTPPFTIDGALQVLEAMTSEPGSLGIAARFAKARAILAWPRSRSGT